MSDLFDSIRKAQLERLLALGWKKVQAYGREYWEHPESHGWFSEAHALKWLDEQGEKHAGTD